MASISVIAILLVAMVYAEDQINQADEIAEMLAKYPSWSFEVESVESVLQKSMESLKSAGLDGISPDILRKKILRSVGPNSKHIIRKTGDPKWPKSVPTFFDARDHWPKCKQLMSEVDDEGSCIADSPVVAASVATDRLCIHTNGTFQDRLAAEVLAACAEGCTIDPWAPLSFRHIKDHGIPTGGRYGSKSGCLPYSEKPCLHRFSNSSANPRDNLRKTKLKPCDKEMPYDHFCPKTCSNKKYKNKMENDLHKFVIWYYIITHEYVLRREIMAYGPLGTSLVLFSDFYDHKGDGMYYRNRNASVFVTTDKYVKIIGWGEENGVPYWLCLNTWNNWGKEKVFKILRGFNYLWIEWMPLTGIFGL